MAWKDLTERYGNCKSAHKQFTRWTNSALLDGMGSGMVIVETAHDSQNDP